MNNLADKIKEYLITHYYFKEEACKKMANHIADIVEREKFLSCTERYTYHNKVLRLEKENTELQQELDKYRLVASGEIEDRLVNYGVKKMFIGSIEIEDIFKRLDGQISEIYIKEIGRE